MPSPSNGKGRFVFSDTDMLCALEVHVPSIRAIHSSIAPFMQTVADWEPSELSSFDNKIRRNFKAAKATIHKAFSTAAISRSQAKRLDECEIIHDVDLYTLLEMNWAMHMLLRSIQDVHTSYELIYNTLCARIIGRSPFCVELNDLNHYYGALTQARLKLIDKLAEVNANVTKLADNLPGMLYATEAAIEAFSACTDVRDSLMLLKDAHHRGFEYARRPF